MKGKNKIEINPASKTGIKISAEFENGSSPAVQSMDMNYEKMTFLDTYGGAEYKTIISQLGLYWRSDIGGKTERASLTGGLFECSDADVKGNLTCRGTLDVRGQKNRLIDTKNYGSIRMAAYETASPMFGDIGSGVIGEDGSCYIGLSPVFLETINTACEYQVFLQAYTDGRLYADRREPTYFIVCGTPGLQFAWEVKARQRGYEINRFDQQREKLETKDKEDYAAAGLEHYKNYVKELIR